MGGSLKAEGLGDGECGIIHSQAALEDATLAVVFILATQFATAPSFLS